MGKVLVIGGSGYLGQFVVDDLSSSYEVGWLMVCGSRSQRSMRSAYRVTTETCTRETGRDLRSQVAFTHHSSVAPTTFAPGVKAFWVGAAPYCTHPLHSRGTCTETRHERLLPSSRWI